MFGSSTGNTGFSFGSNTGNTASGGGLFGSLLSAAPTGFGASNTGTQPASGGLFGSTTTASQPSGGLFGKPAAPTTAGSNTGLFGSNTGAPGTTGSGGLFGSTTNAGTGSLLKRPSSAGPTSTTTGAFGSGGLFGGNSATNQASTGTTAGAGGLFGSKPAGTTTGTGLFGSTTGNTNTGTTGGGLFGSNTGTSTGTGLFGSTANNANTSTTGGGLFGSNNAATGAQTGGLFGSNPAAAKPGGLFGTTATSNTASGGLFGNTAGTTSGGLFGQGTSNTTGGLFAKPNTLGTSNLAGVAMNNVAQVNPLQSLPLTAMTRVSDLPPQLRQKLEEFDKYVNTQHETAKVLEKDKSKHNQMILSIPQDIDYLQNKLLNTSQALNFDQVELVQFKELNYELIDDMNNIQQLIVQLSKPGTKLSSSFHLHEFFLKKIKKFNTVLSEYERLINELNLLLGSLENGFEKGKGNLAQVVLVVQSQYNLFLEVCENMALLHKEISKKVSAN